MRLAVIFAFVALIATVAAQPSPPGIPGQSSGLTPVQLSPVQQMALQNMLGGQQIGGFGATPVTPMLGGFGATPVTQPIVSPMLGGFGAAPTTQPILGGFGATQPILGGYGIPLGNTGTIPPVLPQNFGNPPAAWGQLQQPILSPMQAQNLVPIDQLQQQLNQRVAAMAGPAQLSGQAFQTLAQQGYAPLPMRIGA